MAHVNPVQIQKFLKGVDYPARKATLLETARREGADEQVCASLEQLPDKEFETPASVSKAFGDLPDAPEGGAAAGDAAFVAQAAQDAMAEIQRCELALEKSASVQVRQCAQTMLDDHSELGAQIERYAGHRQLDLPRDVRPEQAAAFKKLSKMKGDEFDHLFIEQSREDHARDIKVFAHYAGEGVDGELRKLSRSGEQMLKKHEKLISGLGDKP